MEHMSLHEILRIIQENVKRLIINIISNKYRIIKNFIFNYIKVVLRNKLDLVTFIKRLLIKIVIKPYMVWIFYTLVLLIWNITVIYAEERIPDHIPEIFEKERQEWYRQQYDKNHGTTDKSGQIFYRYKNPQKMSPDLIEFDGYRDNDNNWVKNPPLPYNFINYYEKARLLKAWQEKYSIVQVNQNVNTGFNISSDNISIMSSKIPVSYNILVTEKDIITNLTNTYKIQNADSIVPENNKSVEILNNNSTLEQLKKSTEQAYLAHLETLDINEKAQKICQHLYLKVIQNMPKTNIDKLTIKTIVSQCVKNDFTSSSWKLVAGEQLGLNTVASQMAAINHANITVNPNGLSDIERNLLAHINVNIMFTNYAIEHNYNIDNLLQNTLMYEHVFVQQFKTK